MNPIRGLIGILLQILADTAKIPWAKILALGEVEGARFVLPLFRTALLKRAPKVGLTAQKQGWGYDSKTADRPDGDGQAWSADLVYRFFKQLPGRLTDWVRDALAHGVYARVQPDLTATTTPEEAARLVAEAIYAETRAWAERLLKVTL
jgi:hypothetical protein